MFDSPRPPTSLDGHPGKERGPLPPDETPAPDPVRTTYDTVAEPYAAAFADELAGKPLDRALLDAFAGQVLAAGGEPVVGDVGCGPGYASRHLHGHGLRPVGVDLSPGMLAQARRLHPGLDLLQGSLLALPVPDAAWAGVLSLYSVIHLPPDRQPAALAEFARVLRPGGRLLLAFHAGVGQLHLDEWFGRPVDVDGHLLDPDRVAGQAAAAGFTVEARLDRRPYPGIETGTERTYLFARRDG